LRYDQDEIAQLLEGFGREVGSKLDHVLWSTEFHPSSRYALAGNLVFAPADARERELAVVGVRLDGRTGWIFDAIDRASVVMAESSVQATADFATVLQALSAFLDNAAPLVEAALRDT
jgi:hypothetical protein